MKVDYELCWSPSDLERYTPYGYAIQASALHSIQEAIAAPKAAQEAAHPSTEVLNTVADMQYWPNHLSSRSPPPLLLQRQYRALTRGMMGRCQPQRHGRGC